jgi:adenine-specific DNA-methyltransferase
MPKLDWIGKQYVVNHTDEVPFRLLERVPDASVGEDSGNVIVHGDNLEAPKALLPYYRERVKLVFIDPPYNTGNENWVYNDRMNAPKIKEWLGATKRSSATTGRRWIPNAAISRWSRGATCRAP